LRRINEITSGVRRPRSSTRSVKAHTEAREARAIAKPIGIELV
jgi:hypothetical protein